MSFIDLNKKSGAKGLVDSAPSWAKDGLKERMKNGASVERAIGDLSKSPFFDEAWIIR